MAASYYRGSCVRLNSSECNALPKRGAQDIVSTLHAVNVSTPLQDSDFNMRNGERRRDTLQQWQVAAAVRVFDPS